MEASAKRVKIKVGTVAPEGSIWHNTLIRLAQRWKDASGGKVKLKIYPGGVAGDEGDMIRKMRIGQLHMGTLTNIGLSQIAKEANAVQVPMLVRSYGELDYVREKLGPQIAAKMNDAGFIVLSWGDAGFIHQFSKAPAPTVDHFRKLKYYVWNEDSASEKAWRTAKFKPVPLSATDVLSALQTGMIESFGATPVLALSSQWFGLAKNMVAVNWAPLAGANVITKKRWEKIDASLRPVLLKIAREEGASLNQQVRELDAKAIKAMTDRGLKVHTPTAAELKQWEAAAELAYPIIRGEVVPEKIFDDVKRHAAEYRARANK